MKTKLAFGLSVATLVLGSCSLRADESSDRLALKVMSDHIDFLRGGSLLARYNHGPEVAKPFFFPLRGPEGLSLTRAWPMEKAPPGGSTDHVHQKSAWFCHGDVIPEGLKLNDRISGVKGVDFWSEQKGHGVIVCTGVDQHPPGKDRAGATTSNEWRTAAGLKILDEQRAIVFRDLGASQLIVVAIDLHAREFPITFGDTKEGSFGVRVSDFITGKLPKGKVADRDGKRGGGKIQNADGKIGEKACWGYRSAWCDYSGMIEGHHIGIAILDDPGNPYRACWHVRAYGLMAANPFGRAKAGFPAVKGQSDLVRLEKGEHLKLRYGILLHPGDAGEGKVAEGFQSFVDLTKK